MTKTDTLRDFLTLSADACEARVKECFERIADMLMHSFAIRKGNNFYLFRDIEFYFYNRNHKDIITHPRCCDAMQWFVNDFGGIDLTFQSKIEMVTCKNRSKKTVRKAMLNDDSCFGGILVRGLINEQTGDVIDGPWACAELFRMHDATGAINDYPILVEHGSARAEAIAMPRCNLRRSNQTAEDKVRYLLSAYANDASQSLIEELTDAFQHYFDSKYRYKI